MTYTYALLPVSPACYQEIHTKLEEAGYQHAFHKDSSGSVIDMHGIALRLENEMDETEQAAVTQGEADSPDFRSELSSLLNRFSKENGSNTPDYVLRDYLCSCLKAFDTAVNARQASQG